MGKNSRNRGLGLLTAPALGLAIFLGAMPALAAEIPTKVKNPALVEGAISRSGQTRVIVHVATGLDDRTVNRRLGDRNQRGVTLNELRSRIEPVMLSYFPSRRGGSGRIVKSIDSIGAFAADVTRAELDRMKNDPRVLKIEIDEEKSINLNGSLPLIGMSTSMDAQPNGTESDGSKPRAIAVIDTGVERNHPFIGQSRVVAEACFLTKARCPDGTFDQVAPGAAAPASGQSTAFHGTHVSGIAMGRYQSGAPVSRGVASNGRLVMVNVFGGQTTAYTSDIIQGLEFIYGLVVSKIDPAKPEGPDNENPYRIASVNMSLGGGSFTDSCDDDPEKDVIDRLRAKGVITAAAAGNDGNRLQMSSPGCISSVLSVAATSKSGSIASYSNINRTTDVFAPGGVSGACITSSVLGGLYAAYCGTSMATPHVAGAIALLRAAKPTATADEIEMALKSSGVMVKDTRSSGVYSAPLIKVPNAISALANQQTVMLDAQISGQGALFSQPTGLSCGTTCSSAFLKGQSVTLTAAPSETAMLTGWGGDAASCGTAATCTLTLSQNASVQANFATATWIKPLDTVLDNALTWVNPALAGSAPWFGQNKTLRSGDATGYAISSDIGDKQTASMETTVTGPGTLSFYWSVSSESNFDFLEFWINDVKQTGSISGSVGWTQRTFTLPAGTQKLRWVYRKDDYVSSGSDAGYLDRVIFTAGTTPPPPPPPTAYSLKLTKSGYRRYGSVSSSPAGISCGTTCSSQTASFPVGQLVTLTARASSGRSFVDWTGGCTGATTTCSVKMDAAKSVTATFK